MLDLCVEQIRFDWWVVTDGITGLALGAGETKEEATLAVKAKIDAKGIDAYWRAVIGWLEVKPLSPRYKWVQDARP